MDDMYSSVTQLSANWNETKRSMLGFFYEFLLNSKGFYSKWVEKIELMIIVWFVCTFSNQNFSNFQSFSGPLKKNHNLNWAAVWLKRRRKLTIVSMHSSVFGNISIHKWLSFVRNHITNANIEKYGVQIASMCRALQRLFGFRCVFSLCVKIIDLTIGLPNKNSINDKKSRTRESLNQQIDEKPKKKKEKRKWEAKPTGKHN